MKLAVAPSVAVALLLAPNGRGLAQPRAHETPASIAAEKKVQLLLDQARPLVEKKRWAQARPILELAARIDPSAPSLQSWLGQARAAVKDPRAEATLRAALALDPTDAAAAEALAGLMEKKDPRLAARAYLVAARVRKNREGALRAARLAALADPELAHEAYTFAASLEPLSAADAAAHKALARPPPEELERRRKIALEALSAVRLFMEKKDLEEAGRLLGALLQQDPWNLAALWMGVSLAAARGDLAGEEQRVMALVAIDPEAPGLNKLLGRLYTKKGDAARARAAWENHLRRVRDDGEAHRALGELDLAEGHPESAVGHAKVLLALDPRDTGALLMLGRGRARSGDCIGAVPALARVVENTDLAEPYAALGACYQALGREGQARAALAAALARDPHQPVANETLAAMAAAARRFDEAARYLSAAAESPERSRDPASYVRAGEAWLAAADLEKAEAALEKALALDPEHGRARYLSGRVLMARGKPQAVPALVAASRALPNDPDVRATLALALLAFGNRSAAEGAARAAVKLAPHHPLANRVLGNLLFPSREAQKYLEIAAKGGAEAPDLAKLAELQLRAKDPAAAARTLAKIHGGDPARVASLAARAALAAGDLVAAERRVSAAIIAAPLDREILRLGADIAFERGEYALAADRFKKAEGAVPSLPSRVRMCVLLALAGDHAAAVVQGRQAQLMGSDAPALHACLGFSLRKYGKAGEAQAALALARRKAEKDLEANVVLAALAVEEKREEAVLDRTRAVLAASAWNVPANAHRGLVLAARERWEEAIPFLERAFAGKPSGEVGAALVRAALQVDRPELARAVLADLPEGELPADLVALLAAEARMAVGDHGRAAALYERSILASAATTVEVQKALETARLRHDADKRAAAALDARTEYDALDPGLHAARARARALLGQLDAAREIHARAEELGRRLLAARRKAIPPQDLRRVLVAPFGVGKGGPRWLSMAAADGLAARIGRAASVVLVSPRRGVALRPEDADDVEKLRDVARGAGADLLVVGEARLKSGRVDLAVDVHATNSGAAVQTVSAKGPELGGALTSLAIELLERFAPAAPEELEWLVTGHESNLQALRLYSEGRLRENADDLRGALASYREALLAAPGFTAAMAALDRTTRAVEPRNRLAVVELRKMTEGPLDWFGIGFAEAMAEKLAQVPGLDVVPRERVRPEEERIDPAGEVQQFLELGGRLKAAIVVLGAYHLFGKEMVVNVRAVDIATGAELFSEWMHVRAGQVLPAADALAEQLARRLVGLVSEEELGRLRLARDPVRFAARMEELLAERLHRVGQVAQAAPPPAPPSAPTAPPASPAPPPSPVFFLSAHSGLGDGVLALRFSLYGQATREWRWGVVLGTQSTSGLSLDRGASAASAVGLHEVGVTGEWRLGQGRFRLVGAGDATVGLGRLRATFPSPVRGTAAGSLSPRLGAEIEWDGWSLGLGAGYQWVFGGGQGALAPLDHPFVHLGLSGWSRDLKDWDPAGLRLGYRVHLVNTEGIVPFHAYGGLFGQGGGLLASHGFTVGRDMNAFYFGYGRNSRNGDENAGRLLYYEFSWDFTWRVFPGQAWISPTLGTRLGLVHFGDSREGLYGAPPVGLLTALRAGVEVGGARWLFAPGLGYDALFVAGEAGSEVADLSGFFVDLGVSLRL